MPRFLSTRALLPLILGALACLVGCAPEPAVESPPEAPTERDLFKIPSAPPFPILLELPPEAAQPLKTFLEQRFPDNPERRLVWEDSSASSPDWEIAFVRPWSLADLEVRGMDLRTWLDEIYPLHPSDFFLPVSSVERDGNLRSLPISLAPDFLYARSLPEGKEALDSGALAAYFANGGRIALPRGPAGSWYRARLRIPESLIDWFDPEDSPTPFLSGQAGMAVGDRSWPARHRIPSSQMRSLAEVLPGVPDWGCRMVVSAQCRLPELARDILRVLLTEGQESLTGFGGGSFPVRRSVYQSPRVQGMFLLAPRAALDATLSALIDPRE